VASEFCGTSISSNGPPQAQTNALLTHNPHLLLGRSDQRGYVALTLNSQLLQAELMTVQQPWNPHSAVDVAARYVVDARQPGPQRA
jgi:alkaline phosphatase D